MTARYLIGVLLVTATTCQALAQAGVSWSLTKKAGQPCLMGLSTDDEGDIELWALCKKGGVIEIGAGANSGVGEGDGKPVLLVLKSRKHEARLEGKSRRSANWEMTTGNELRTQIKPDDPLFAVLTSGAPIAVTGNITEPVSWTVNGLKAKAAGFLSACKK